MEIAAMPLRLVKAPNAARAKSKTPPLYVRGTHLGIDVFRSTKTADRALAKKELKRIEKEIEAGRFEKGKGPTFAGALAAYVKAGGSKRFLKPLLNHFGETPLANIDQEAFDEAASALYPNATAATQNRQVYTPLSAILARAGIDKRWKRPIGAQGQQRTQWLWPEDAEKLLAAAATVDREFACLLIYLLYTGLRLSEALRLDARDLRLDEGFAYAGKTKNGQPRAVHLTRFACGTLRSHPRGIGETGPVFRFTKGRYLYDLLGRTKRAMGDGGEYGWITFHTLRHTYAVWMRRFAGLDTRGLVGTGAWTDQKSAARYSHVVTTEEARKADLLPVPKLKEVDDDKTGTAS